VADLNGADAKLVRAAGGVVWRVGSDADAEVLVVHRPLYDDWSLPKGKLEAGETDEVAAVREIEEETGLRCELGPELTSVSYIDRKGRPKVVRYWAAVALSGTFEPNQEVDEVRWLPVVAAASRLTYDRDQDVLKAFVRRVWSRRRHPAGNRDDGDAVVPPVPDRSMSPAEWRAFLLDPPRPGVVATVRADGRPHAAPVWFDLEGAAIVFNTGAATVKGRNLARDPRATLCVQDDRPPYSFVLIEGSVELLDDPVYVRDVATRLGGRYMGADQAEAYGARNGVPGELVVRLTPIRVVSARDVAD
jgi:PPOX class probable F420-dependent enzyme